MPDEKDREEEGYEEESDYEDEYADDEEYDEEEQAADEQEYEEEEEQPPQDPNELVTIKTFVFPFQAQAAKLHMDELEIPAFLADLETVQMDWFLGGAIGNIKLQVRRCDVETALGALERQTDTSTDEEETDEADSAVCLSCGKPLPEEVTTCPSCGWSYADDQETRIQP